MEETRARHKTGLKILPTISITLNSKGKVMQEVAVGERPSRDDGAPTTPPRIPITLHTQHKALQGITTESITSKANRALVIIDLQNEFLSEAGNFPISPDCKPALVTNLKTLIPNFRHPGGHIIWVKAIYKELTEEPESMKEYERGDGIVGSNDWLANSTHVHPTPCCAADTFGAEIFPEVFALSEPEDAVVTKEWYSAFNGSTALLEVLRDRKVADVYFCGVASGTCVLATVVNAVRLGEMKVHVIPECMGWRRYNTHEEALRRFEELGVDVAYMSNLDGRTIGYS